LLFTVEDPGKRSLLYIPAINWTRENGFMVGMAMHDGFLIPKPVEFFVMPFYSFNNQGLAGSGRIAFNITPFDKIIRMATISFDGTQFGAPGNQNYHKIMAGAELFFRTPQMNDPIKQKIYTRYIIASDLSDLLLMENANMLSYLQYGYVIERSGIINPFALSVSMESNRSYNKVFAQFNYRFSYIGMDNGLDMRLFAGTMINNGNTGSFYGFSPSGRGGRELYLFQSDYPDRFSVFPDSFFSRQMTLTEGGLVSPVNDTLGYRNWLINLSFASNLPGKASGIPVKPFLNLLLTDKIDGVGCTPHLYFETGLKTGFWNFFEIYVPVLVSRDLSSFTGSFKNRIRFVLKLDAIRQFKLR
jgi:hypothetical protein